MTITECVQLLHENDNYLILTHARPDGDTLCSAAALCSALRRIGKRAVLLDNPETTDTYRQFMGAYFGTCASDDPYILSVDLAGETMFPVGFSGKVRLAIDHHASNSGYACNTVLDGSMAACGEIVMRIIESLTGGLTPEEATMLYVAIATDCGCFCFGNTTAQTFRDAAHLLDLGVENGPLNKQFFRSFTLARLKLEGMIYTGLRSYRNNSVNVAIITQEMMRMSGATDNDCDDLASLAGKVKGNVVAITVREIGPGRSKASVRTNRSVDSSAICSRLGGGGHYMAAGCTVDMGPFELADRLVDIACEMMK